MADQASTPTTGCRERPCPMPHYRDGYCRHHWWMFFTPIFQARESGPSIARPCRRGFEPSIKER